MTNPRSRAIPRKNDEEGFSGGPRENVKQPGSTALHVKQPRAVPRSRTRGVHADVGRRCFAPLCRCCASRTLASLSVARRALLFFFLRSSRSDARRVLPVRSSLSPPHPHTHPHARAAPLPHTMRGDCATPMSKSSSSPPFLLLFFSSVLLLFPFVFFFLPSNVRFAHARAVGTRKHAGFA